MSKLSKRCLYCDSNKNIDNSDIIPKAITNKKLTYRSVCHKHNEDIGNLYEDDILKKLAFLRRLFDIPSRKKKNDITFRVNMRFNDSEVIKFSKFSGIAEAFWNGIEGETLNGEKRALKILSHSKPDTQIIDKFTLEYCDFRDIAKTLTDIKMFKLVAKIGYEYYCKSNMITGFDKKQFSNIVSFILDKNNFDNNFIEIVTDWNLYNELNTNIEYGTHALLITKSTNGSEHVIFSLWGIIIFKIFIKKWPIIFPYTTFNNYFACRYDGSLVEFKATTLGRSHKLQSTSIINSDIRSKIYTNIEAVFKYSLFTKAGKSREIKRIKNVLSSTRSLEEKLFYLVGAQDQEVISFCYCILLLYENRSLYDSTLSFNQNIFSLFGNNEFIHINPKDYNDMVSKMGEEVFLETLVKAIDYFESIN